MFGTFSPLLLFVIVFEGDRLFALAQYTSLHALKLRLPGRCKEGDFDCGEGQCVPITRFHDGKPDCRNGADEACLLGQVRCGAYCVNLADSLSCLMHPQCDNTSRAPPFCSRSKEKLCSEPLSFPCKGYGECVMWRWLLDGKKDCIDESDEDIAYVSTLEPTFRCYYNSTGLSSPLPPLTYPPPSLPRPAVPCPFCKPPIPLYPNRPYPFVPVTRPPTYPLPATTININPYQPLQPTTTPRYPFATLLPSATEAPSPTLPSHQGLIPIDNSQYPYPEEGEETTDYGKEQGGTGKSGFYPEQSFTKPIKWTVPTTSYTPYVVVPDETSSSAPNVKPIQTTSGSHEAQTSEGGKWGSEEENGQVVGPSGVGVSKGKGAGQGQAKPTSGYIYPNKETVTGDKGKTRPVEEEYGETLQPFIIPAATSGANYIISTQKPTIEYPYSGTSAPPYSQPGGIIYVGPGGYRPDSGGQPYRPQPSSSIPVTPIMPIVGVQTYAPPITNRPPLQTIGTVQPSESGGFGPSVTATKSPFYPFTQPTEESPFTVIQILPGGGTKESATISPTDKSGPAISVSTGGGEKEPQANATSTNNEGQAATGTGNGITDTSEAATTKLNACLFSLLERARIKNRKAECDCPPGKMRIGSGCRASNITTVAVTLEKVCGESVNSSIDKQFLVVNKVREALPYPACIRSISGNRLLVNVLCDDCQLDVFQRKVDGKTNDFVIAKTEALNADLCTNAEWTGCHSKAECTVDSSGLRYECECLSGTHDTSIDGRGRRCEGEVNEYECIYIFGICLTMIIPILFGLLFLLAIFISLCCRYCECCLCCYERIKVHPTSPVNVKVGEIQKDIHTSHIANIFADTLKRSATGATAMGSALALAEVHRRKAKISKTPEMSQVVEIDSTQDTMAPSLNSRASPQVYVGPNPLALAGALQKQLSSSAILERGETGSLPGITTQVETPILDRGSAKSLPRVDSKPGGLKESFTSPDLTKRAASVPGPVPPPLLSSDSAPTLPTLRLPLPVPASAPDATRDDRHTQEVKVVKVKEEPQEEEPSSARSTHAPPTIWDTYKVLGDQYAGKMAEGEKTPDSLEALIEERFPVVVAKENENANLSRVNNNIPLPLEAIVTGADLVHSEEPSRSEVVGQPNVSSRSEQRSARLAEMLGVTTIEQPPASEQRVGNQSAIGAVYDKPTTSSIPTSTKGAGIESRAPDASELEKRLQGIIVPKEVKEEDRKIPRGDTEILEEMAKRRIELPLSPLASLIEKPITAALEAALASLQSPKKEKAAAADMEDDYSKKRRRTPVKQKTVEKIVDVEIDRPLRGIVSGRSRSSEKMSKKKQKRGLTHSQSVSLSEYEAEDGEGEKLRRREAKKDDESEEVFVPHKGRISARGSARQEDSKLRRKFRGSSTEESDPEVSFAQRMYAKSLAKFPGLGKPFRSESGRHSYKDRHKRKSRIVRTLSSISEKSGEQPPDAALQDIDPMDAIMSCPSTTRLSFDWKGATPKRRKADELPDGWQSKYRFVSSPEIKDVTKQRSLERLDRAHLEMNDGDDDVDPYNIDNSGRKKKKHRRASLDLDDGIEDRHYKDQPPSTSRYAGPTSEFVPQSIMKRETNESGIKSALPSYVTRRIATRSETLHRKQMPVKFQSASESSQIISQQEEDPTLEENLYDDRPPWDSRPFRETPEKELAWDTYLPPLPKSTLPSDSSQRVRQADTHSASSSPRRRSKRSDSHYSLGSFHSAGTSRNARAVSPYFDPVKDFGKPHKESLWWPRRRSPNP